MRVELDRPYLKAVITECGECDEQGAVWDGAVARQCPACKPDRDAVRLFNKARMPPSALRVCRRGVPDIEAGTLEKSAHRLARLVLKRTVSTAKAYLSGELPDEERLLGVVSGLEGRGKTWLLFGAMLHSCRSGVGCLYLSVRDPWAALKELGAGDQDLGRRIAMAAPLLALDDLGSHRHPAGSALIRDLITDRLTGALPVICATQSDPDTFKDEFGPTIGDHARANHTTLINGSLRGRLD